MIKKGDIVRIEPKSEGDIENFYPEGSNFSYTDVGACKYAGKEVEVLRLHGCKVERCCITTHPIIREGELHVPQDWLRKVDVDSFVELWR